MPHEQSLSWVKGGVLASAAIGCVFVHNYVGAAQFGAQLVDWAGQVWRRASSAPTAAGRPTRSIEAAIEMAAVSSPSARGAVPADADPQDMVRQRARSIAASPLAGSDFDNWLLAELQLKIAERAAEIAGRKNPPADSAAWQQAELEVRISQRASEIAHSRDAGPELDNWLRAEREVLTTRRAREIDALPDAGGELDNWLRAEREVLIAQRARELDGGSGITRELDNWLRAERWVFVKQRAEQLSRLSEGEGDQADWYEAEREVDAFYDFEQGLIRSRAAELATQARRSDEANWLQAEGELRSRHLLRPWARPRPTATFPKVTATRLLNHQASRLCWLRHDDRLCLAIGDVVGNVGLWDPFGLRVMERLRPAPQAVSALTAARVDGQSIVAYSSQGGPIHVRDLVAGEDFTFDLPFDRSGRGLGMPATVRDLFAVPVHDAVQLEAAVNEFVIHYSCLHRHEVGQRSAFVNALRGFAVGPSNLVAVRESLVSDIVAWDPSPGGTAWHLPKNRYSNKRGSPSAVAWGPMQNGAAQLFACHFGTIVRWSVADGREEQVYPVPGDWQISSAHWVQASGGARLACIGSGVVRLLAFTDGTLTELAFDDVVAGASDESGLLALGHGDCVTILGADALA
jgi:hypothetical protein